MRFGYISFLIKYTTRCTITIAANTVQYVRDKNGDLEPKAAIVHRFILQICDFFSREGTVRPTRLLSRGNLDHPSGVDLCIRLTATRLGLPDGGIP